jgi:two-component system cell cycle response regulator DivK
LAKILIVEDNALNIKLFCDLLAAHGHDPQAVTDSRLALDAAHQFAPDLVITDIQLPHVSGLDLIRLPRYRSWP